jgi:hypothetical protein
MIAIQICVCIVGLCFALLLFANVMIPACNLPLFLSLILSTYPGILFLNVVVCYTTRIVAHFPLVSTTASVNLVLFPSKESAVVLFNKLNPSCCNLKGADVIADTNALKLKP